MTRLKSGTLLVWLRLAAVLLVGGVLVATWKWIPRSAADVQEFAGWFALHRHAWYALPLVSMAFIVLGLAMVPVILLIAATGIAFGPLLGPVYAMAGCLASAATGFAIGRWLGPRGVERLGGDRVTRLARGLKRNGVLAVFLVRKLPAPFSLANIAVGASTVSFRDFMVGTILGMGAFVVALAGFGYQLTRALQDPSPATVLIAALFVGVPLTLAWAINHAFRRAGPAG